MCYVITFVHRHQAAVTVALIAALLVAAALCGLDDYGDRMRDLRGLR